MTLKKLTCNFLQSFTIIIICWCFTYWMKRIFLDSKFQFFDILCTIHPPRLDMRRDFKTASQTCYDKKWIHATQCTPEKKSACDIPKLFSALTDFKPITSWLFLQQQFLFLDLALYSYPNLFDQCIWLPFIISGERGNILYWLFCKFVFEIRGNHY